MPAASQEGTPVVHIHGSTQLLPASGADARARALRARGGPRAALSFCGACGAEASCRVLLTSLAARPWACAGVW